MTRVYNFSAGPAALPEEVLKQAAQEMLDWHGSGMSVMEMSHRGKEFMSIAQKAEADVRELLNIPANYKVLFLHGGATLQFAMVPLNLRGDRKSADYVNTGAWSKKAIGEAKKLGAINIAATAEASNFTRIPPPGEWHLDPDAAYVHYTINETIGGVEFHSIPDVGKVPLVADASSTLLSRPLDIARFGVIYAGAQKNFGPAGLALAIVRDDLLGRAGPTVPNMLDFKVHAENESMYNTPPTYGWYMAGLVFDWLKKRGGLKAMAQNNERKAKKLYDYIDASGFYRNPVVLAHRSWMNVPFTLADAGLDDEFLKGARGAGMLQLKGHRSVGGMRASIYNAMPEAGVDALIDYMKAFAANRG